MFATLPNFCESFFTDDDLGQGEETLIPRPPDMLNSQKTTETISLSRISGFEIAHINTGKGGLLHHIDELKDFITKYGLRSLKPG